MGYRLMSALGITAGLWSNAKGDEIMLIWPFRTMIAMSMTLYCHVRLAFA